MEVVNSSRVYKMPNNSRYLLDYPRTLFLMAVPGLTDHSKVVPLLLSLSTLFLMSVLTDRSKVVPLLISLSSLFLMSLRASKFLLTVLRWYLYCYLYLPSS